MTLAEYIKTGYFPKFIACGMHILASVPIYNGAAVGDYTVSLA